LFPEKFFLTQNEKQNLAPLKLCFAFPQTLKSGYGPACTSSLFFRGVQLTHVAVQIQKINVESLTVLLHYVSK